MAAGGLPVMARLLLSDQIGASIIDAAAVMAILARGGRAHRVCNVFVAPERIAAMQRCTGVRRQHSSQNAPATTRCAEHCRARGRVCSAPAGATGCFRCQVQPAQHKPGCGREAVSQNPSVFFSRTPSHLRRLLGLTKILLRDAIIIPVVSSAGCHHCLRRAAGPDQDRAQPGSTGGARRRGGERRGRHPGPVPRQHRLPGETLNLECSQKSPICRKQGTCTREQSRILDLCRGNTGCQVRILGLCERQKDGILSCRSLQDRAPF